jgi:hypothetical protein
MSLFRPIRKVTDPRGREWEIYVSRYSTPKGEPNDDDSLADEVTGIGGSGGRGLAELLLELPRFLYHQLLVPIGRFLVLAPYRSLRSRRATTVWIEAISWGVAPHKESIRWTTTPDHASRVLEQIARGLAAGDVARPLGGVFQGRSSS